MIPYLVDLTTRISSGLGHYPDHWRARHAEFIGAAQHADGGFSGREGAGDLYYSGFALRSLAVLGVLNKEVAQRATRFLQQKMANEAPIVDFFSLLYGATLLEMSAGIDVFSDANSDWRDRVGDALEQLRREDGGYAKGPEGVASSTYHTFLVLLCLQLLDQPIPDPVGIESFLMSQRGEDGGFREIRVQKRAGTNPTAAAVAGLQILGCLDDETSEDAIEFLCELVSDEGGHRANHRIPIADLLSTFTGVLTLIQLGAKDMIDREAVVRYTRSLEGDRGGFHGAVWDDGLDVEYTFYGLGVLALLAPI